MIKIFVLLCIGILVGKNLTLPIWFWGLCISASFIGAYRVKSFIPKINPYSIASYIFIGALIFSIRVGVPGIIDKSVLVEGEGVFSCTIVSDPEDGTLGWYMTVDIHSPDIGLAEVRIYAEVDSDNRPFSYGDKIRISGRKAVPSRARNPGDMDYAMFLARRGIHVLVHVDSISDVEILSDKAGNKLLRKIYSGKRVFMDAVSLVVGKEHSPLIRALIFGEKRGLSTDIEENFRKSGLYHMLVVSGLHVGLIASFCFLVFNKIFGNKAACITSITAVIIYVIIAGFKVSLIRAGIMCVLTMVGIINNRKKDLCSSLALAGVILLFINPLNLYDLGFQMSFIATLSIIKLAPVIKERLRIIPGWIGSGLSISIAASLGIAPLLIYHFNLISLISPFANIIAAPLLGVIIISSFFSGVLVLIIPVAAIPLSYVLGVLIDIFCKMAEVLTELPVSFIYLQSPPVFLILFYYTLLYWISTCSECNIFEDENSVLRKRALISIALILAIVIWSSVLMPSDLLTLTFFDVGQGDAILIEFSRGPVILVDGGDAFMRYDAGRDVILPYLRREGINRIDIIFLSHIHRDHIGGIPEVLREVDVGLLVDGCPPFSSSTYYEIIELVREREIPYANLRGGEVIFLGEDINIHIINGYSSDIDDPNNNSLVLRIEYGRWSALLTSDIEEETIGRLVARGMDPVSVVQIPHHGGNAGNIDEFIRVLSPEDAVISVGTNRFGHPRPEIIDVLKKENVRVYRTDIHGAVIIHTNGWTYNVTTVREVPERWEPGGEESFKVY